MTVRSLMYALALTCAALPVAAQGIDAQYTLSLRGITGGTIALSGREQGRSYSVAAAARASGLVGALVKYGYEGTAQGRIQGGSYVSSVYTEVEVDDGERTSSVTRFRGRTPESVTFDPPRPPEPTDIDPAAQSGVIDPLTALYAVLQPTPAAQACNARFDLFDGRHVSRLSVGQPQPQANGTIICGAEYRRLRGYSPEDLEKRETVDMTFLYAPLPDGRMQVREIRSRTRLGDAVLRRQ